MSISQVIALVNQMEADGVIERYAVGGAVGATFYLEPVATLDVDIFVGFRPGPGQLLVSPQPILDYLTARGGVLKGEYIVVAGWPVQFLPPPSPLVEEALAEAVTVDVEGTPVRVFTAEHLAAIALETGRAKDTARLLEFIEAGAFRADDFQSILARYGLVERWREFERRFLGGAMTFDLQRILESKRALRRDLASRPVAEKLAMLDALRDRARTIREAATRKQSTVSPESQAGVERT